MDNNNLCSAGRTDEESREAGSDLRILRSLRQIMRAVDLYSRRLRTQHDITGPQLVCLLTVAREGPLGQSALSRRVHLSPSTLVGILDRLEAKGLVRRERAQRDRRHIQVSATADGCALILAAPSPLQDSLTRALRSLSETEQDAIARSLERVAELMGAADIEASPILEAGPVGTSGTPSGPR